MTLNVDTLVEMVGVEGARAALRASASLTLSDLRAAVSRDSLPVTGAAKRAEIIDVLLAPHEKRLTYSLDELKRLPQSEIEEYFRKSGCSAAELMLFLERWRIPYKRGLPKAHLIAEAARHISGLGVYEHITGGPKLAEGTHVSHADDGAIRVDGNWYSELGTRLTLRANGDLLEGTYQLRSGSVDSEYDLSGRLGRTSDGRQVLMLSVFWGGERRVAGAATAWLGHLQKGGNEELLSTSWVMIDAQYDLERMVTLVGKELFQRSVVKDDEIHRAKRLLDVPYPRRRLKSGT